MKIKNSHSEVYNDQNNKVVWKIPEDIQGWMYKLWDLMQMKMEDPLFKEKEISDVKSIKK